MFHKPIQLHYISLSFPHKTCFDNFSTQIPYGSRIAIIGQNGSGKSTLLKILQESYEPTEGSVNLPADVKIGYVPQVIENFDSLSGGQRLNKALTQALSLDPNVLLLDEPTNHLDLRNRHSLFRMLGAYQGTLMIVSHDIELLRRCIDTLWHIDHGKIHIFSGNYDDYLREIQTKRSAIESELSTLDRQKKATHQALMKEQERAKKSNLRGEKSIQERKWPTIVSDEKARRAVETSGKKKRSIRDKKEDLTEKLADLRLPEILKPKFSLTATPMSHRTLVSIKEGSVGYKDAPPILSDIYLSIETGKHIRPSAELIF